MITQLEREFFEWLNIPPIFVKKYIDVWSYEVIKEYPKITSDIILEIIAILSQHCNKVMKCYYVIEPMTKEAIKNSVIKDCISLRNIDKSKVKVLFEKNNV